VALVILPSYADPDPTVKDSNFIVEKYVTGISYSPTTMAFEGHDILVLSKESGQVHLFRNGFLQDKPLLSKNVTSVGEQGMLGITTSGKKVYIYFTESSKMHGPPLGKRLYSYDWDGNNLVNETLIKDLKQTQTYHNGGAMTTDLNGAVYLVVGDAGHFGQLQNHPVGTPDDTSVIFKIAPPGPYYAIGIRNSFGLTVDPVTGKLWDTENGPDYGDEVNIVPSYFNSGWEPIMGPANKTQISSLPKFLNYTYHDPQFTWWKTVAPTGLAFATSPGYGKYQNDLFVGDCNNGNIYRFHMNQNRDGFVFNSPQLQDKVINVNKGESMDEIVFGTGFGCVSDVITGPDGLLYIVSLTDGTIYRITPVSTPVFEYLPFIVIPIIVGLFFIYIRKRKKTQSIQN
jgi:glucose/arabinose dehydrogenase